MKQSVQIVTALVCLAGLGSPVLAGVKYWDINDIGGGAGGSAPAGTWNTTGLWWNTDATGGIGGSVTVWNASGDTTDTAVFSAGSDATGSFTVTVGANMLAGFSRIVFEEGAVTVKGTTMGAAAYAYLYPPSAAGTDGTISVGGGAAATLDIPIPSSAGNIVKDGPGTLTVANTPVANFRFGNDAGSYLKINEGAYRVPDLSYPMFDGIDASKLGWARTVHLGSAGASGTLQYTGGSAIWGTHATYHTAVVIGGAGGGVIEVLNTNTVLQLNRPMGGGGPFTKAGPGTLQLNAVANHTGDTVVQGGTLLIGSSGLLSGGGPVTVNSGATLAGSGMINGWVTIASGGTLSPGASIGTLTITSHLTLSGNLFVELNKSVSPSNDVVSVSGTLTNAGTGTVVVTNLGPALMAGDSFQLFNKPVLNGQALTIVSVPGVIWSNKLWVDGSIAVLPTNNVPPPVPATNLTITPAGSTSVTLGGRGAASGVYQVYASTNIALPMSNWWLIGATNSDVGGVIQFLDLEATNQQRFYRLGQPSP